MTSVGKATQVVCGWRNAFDRSNCGGKSFTSVVLSRSVTHWDLLFRAVVSATAAMFLLARLTEVEL